MGACCCAGNNVTKDIESGIKSKIDENEAHYRILLLGSGGSGKTTILKQMRKIHIESMEIPVDAIEGFKQYIRQSVVSYMQKLCKQSKLLNIQISASNAQYCKIMTDLALPMEINKNILKIMQQLWSDQGIRQTLTLRHKYQIHDNVDYFFDHRLPDIANPDYVPTFKDYLRIRRRTTGFILEPFQCKFNNNTHRFVFIDVGGQRNERKKWIGMMAEDISAVVYVVAISEYDLVCFEDNTMMRLTDSLMLFDEVVNRGFMDNKSCVLFFNKWDLFEQKVKGKQPMIDKYYGDFPDNLNPRSCVDVANYVEERFKAIYQQRYPTQSTLLHRHNTCSLDTKQIHRIMTSIQLDVINLNMADSGLF